MIQTVAKYFSKISLCQRLLYICQHLPFGLPRYWEHVSTFVNLKAAKEEEISGDQCQLCYDNMTMLDCTVLQTHDSMFQELCDYSNNVDFPLGFALISSNNICRKCGSQLRVKNRGKQVAKVVVYDEKKGTFMASHYTKFCSKGSCTFRQFYGKHSITAGDDIYFDPDWKECKYFLSTSETAFDMELLRKFDVELLIGQISYQQKARIYNATFGYDITEGKRKKATTTSSADKSLKSLQNLTTTESILKDRKRLCRRRLEEGHLQFAILNIIDCYDFKLQSLSFKDLKELLNKFTPAFHEAFIMRFAGHSCSYPGCKNCLVIDGNMKISREVCKAKEAGYIQYEGLEGAIRTGCLKSPCFESRYCDDHKDFACELKVASSDEVKQNTREMFESGPITRAMAKAKGDTSEIPEDGIIEKILEEKITRSKTYYKVKFLGRTEQESSWEPEEVVPEHLVNLFKCKEQLDVVMKETNYNGQLSKRFVTVAKQIYDLEPAAKRQRISDKIPKEGILIRDKSSINCNTEKDKGKRQRKNERTAGILCGLRPCGVFVTVNELYGCESNSQIYAILHEALRKNEDSFETLEYLIYDDACHLRKYSQNPVRSGLTDCTKKISGLNIVVDKMHMRGHVDAWCKANCDSRTIPELDKVDTEICEQAFSWLSLYKKMTRKMNQEHFMFLVLYLIHLHNVKEEQRLRNSGFII